MTRLTSTQRCYKARPESGMLSVSFSPLILFLSLLFLGGFFLSVILIRDEENCYGAFVI